MITSHVVPRKYVFEICLRNLEEIPLYTEEFLQDFLVIAIAAVYHFQQHVYPGTKDLIFNDGYSIIMTISMQ